MLATGATLIFEHHTNKTQMHHGSRKTRYKNCLPPYPNKSAGWDLGAYIYLCPFKTHSRETNETYCHKEQWSLYVQIQSFIPIFEYKCSALLSLFCIICSWKIQYIIQMSVQVYFNSCLKIPDILYMNVHSCIHISQKSVHNPNIHQQVNG